MLTQLFLVLNLGVHFLSSKTTAWPVEEERGAEGDRQESPIDLIHGIYPGTKWCGWGNIAQVRLSPYDRIIDFQNRIDQVRYGF